ncbi:MAG: aspartyl-phosphate phosphatase Spo0E family protein [Bacillus sp. (in: firmicutes)]
MTYQLVELLENIENKRNMMIFLARSSSMSDQHVIQASTELDDLLNKYLRLTGK